MAKRSSLRNSRPRRVASVNANRTWRLPRGRLSRGVTTSFLPLPVRPYEPLRFNRQVFEDRRLFHPAGPSRPAFSLPRMAAQIVAVDKPRQWAPSQTKALLGFANPKRVMICVRRGIRKEVLHARGVAGKRGLRKPRRNAFSGISC